MAYEKQVELKKSDLSEFNKALRNEKTKAMILTALRGKADEYFRNIASVVANDPKLQECTPVSLICGGLQAAQLQLPLGAGLGYAYLIPYNNNRKGEVEAQFQVGYKGLVQLALRSRMFETINSGIVYDGELLGYDKLSGFFSLAGEKKSDKVIGYFAYIKLNNGGEKGASFTKALYMTVEEVEGHAKRYSQTYKSTNTKTHDSSKWTTDFDAMAQKTVLKLLLSRYAPMCTEIQVAAAADQAVVSEDGVLEYVDNTPDEQENLADRHQAIEDKKAELRANGDGTFEML